MKYFILSAASLVLVACGQNAEHDHAKVDHSGADPSAASHMPSSGNYNSGTYNKSEKTGIIISSAYVTPPFPGRDIAGGFFEVTNYGANDRLVSATSSISDAVEIHTHSEENGVMKMRQIDGVDLVQGETIAFKPGSYHLMMYGASIPEGSETVTITLNYKNAEPTTLEVPLSKTHKNESDHSKMGH